MTMYLAADTIPYFHKRLSGFVIYRVRVRRGGRKRHVVKGQTYGKPKNHGVNELKFARNKQSVAEVFFFWFTRDGLDEVESKLGAVYAFFSRRF